MKDIEITRRKFIQGMAVTGAAAAVGGVDLAQAVEASAEENNENEE